MKVLWGIASLALAAALAFGSRASLAEAMSCEMAGPQAPRDITSQKGDNKVQFPLAKAPQEMNLCNIHFHANAEHTGPGFKTAIGGGANGFKCSGPEAGGLTAAELKAPAHGACHGVRPGDTIEVHWVYTSCATEPGEGLGACVKCKTATHTPTLRVEAQVFIVVNNEAAAKAMKLTDFAHAGKNAKGFHQPKALPEKTGEPIIYRGSTTGPSYSDKACSAEKVTWSVRPSCARIDINSLNAWCASSPFKKDGHAHGARPVVETLARLAPIQP